MNGAGLQKELDTLCEWRRSAEQATIDEAKKSGEWKGTLDGDDYLLEDIKKEYNRRFGEIAKRYREMTDVIENELRAFGKEPRDYGLCEE